MIIIMIMEFLHEFLESMDLNDQLTIYFVFTRCCCLEKSFPIKVNAVFNPETMRKLRLSAKFPH